LQVVSGVKYILVVEVAPTICAKDSNLGAESCPRDSTVDSSVCKITYLHKPWITKAKHVIGNNCTVSQEFVKSDGRKMEMSNEIDGTGAKDVKPPTVVGPNFDRMAETGALEEMTPSRLHDLESMIVVENDEPVQQNKKSQVDVGKRIDEVVVPSTVESQIQLESQPSGEAAVEAESTGSPLLADTEQVMNDFAAPELSTVTPESEEQATTLEPTPETTPKSELSQSKSDSSSDESKDSSEESDSKSRVKRDNKSDCSSSS
jgi:hypothetical protein